MEALVGGLVLLALGWRALDVWAQGQNFDRSSRERMHQIKWTAKERIGAKPPPLPGDPMPDDLVARINGWEDDFAKADEERHIKALYSELKSWDAVKRALPPLMR